ncbi:MAG: ATP-binding protein [Verrucomicrobiota bacterium]
MDMQGFIPRLRLQEEIKVKLKESPVVALLGARQVGKTTLARKISESLEEEVTFFDLESPSGRAPLIETPELALRSCTGTVVIDEIQRMPDLFEILRPLCDDPERKSRFLLLGSAAPELVRGVSESLAGRILFVNVPGFSLQEVGTENQDRLWHRGGFPLSFCSDSDPAAFRWLEGFRATFLERDIPSLGVRVSPVALGRFWTMLAHFHGQIWNATEIGRAMGVSPMTANHYRDLLEGTFMVRVLQPWFENIGKRQVKSPKVYLRDSGVLNHLLGLPDLMSLRSHPKYGASWEGFALEQTLIAHGEKDAWFWATQGGAELDLLMIRGGKKWGFEFKCSDAPSSTKSMHSAIESLGLEHLWILYPGERRFPITDRITALPLRQINNIKFV